MKGDVTDKLIWRILAETQFRKFCLPIQKANIRSCFFFPFAVLWNFELSFNWKNADCLRVGCWGGYVDVIDRPQRNELEENWIFGDVHLLFWARSQNYEKRPLASSCLSSCRSVRLSAWYNSAPTVRIFMRFDAWIFFEKLLRKFKLH
jgi:hypothetical protein